LRNVSITSNNKKQEQIEKMLSHRLLNTSLPIYSTSVHIQIAGVESWQGGWVKDSRIMFQNKGPLHKHCLIASNFNILVLPVHPLGRRVERIPAETTCDNFAHGLRSPTTSKWTSRSMRTPRIFHHDMVSQTRLGSLVRRMFSNTSVEASQYATYCCNFTSILMRICRVAQKNYSTFQTPISHEQYQLSQWKATKLTILQFSFEWYVLLWPCEP